MRTSPRAMGWASLARDPLIVRGMASDADVRSSRLYGLAPEEFTAERNALAAELKAEGDPEGAAHVKALRKPTRAGWEVNRLVRSVSALVYAVIGGGGG